jgi:hypothetical protein
MVKVTPSQLKIIKDPALFIASAFLSIYLDDECAKYEVLIAGPEEDQEIIFRNLVGCPQMNARLKLLPEEYGGIVALYFWKHSYAYGNERARKVASMFRSYQKYYEHEISEEEFQEMYPRFDKRRNSLKARVMDIVGRVPPTKNLPPLPTIYGRPDKGEDGARDSRFHYAPG